MLFNKKNTDKRRFPTKLNDITIEDYLNLELIKNTFKEEAKITKELIKYYNLGDLPIKETELQLAKLANILQTEPKFVQTFKHNGIEFGLIPNFDKLTTGEFIDLDEYQKDPNKIHNIMAILYRPITKKHKHLYQIEKYESSLKYSEQMKSAPAEYYLGVMVFFYNLSINLLNASLTYIQEMKKTVTHSPN
jgi:hypothetical protein